MKCITQNQTAATARPSPDESTVRGLFDHWKQIQQERAEAAEAALKCLPLLVEVCAHKTDQSYILRALLFSLWNGKPVDLSDTLRLDWELKKSLCVVIVAFGTEGPVNFFYDAFTTAFSERNLMDWFLEEAGNATNN